MEEFCLNIKDGIYGRDLLLHLYRLSAQKEASNQIVSAIQKLCLADIDKIKDITDNISLSENEISLLNTLEPDSISPNKEIIARLGDYLQVKKKERRVELIRSSCSAYSTVFEHTREYPYLIRRLQLIRKVKAAFSSELKNVFKYCEEVIYNCQYPYWQSLILTEIRSIAQEQELKGFSSYFEKRVKYFKDQGDYQNALYSIDSLKTIGCINKNEWHIRRALCLEIEGDNHINAKVPNTYYPNTCKYFLDALHEIKDINGCKEIKSRLEKKVTKEQGENIVLIQKCGVNLLREVDVFKIRTTIIDMGINDFKTGYHNMLSLPIISNDVIQEQSLDKDSNSMLSYLFQDYIKLNDRGLKVGKANEVKFKQDLIRNELRSRYIYLLREIKNVMDIDRKLDKESVFYMVYHCGSKFIPQERKYLYAKGVQAGFENDFITASHLLIPQIENSLKFIAEQNYITVSKLSDEIQHDNTLGGTLEKIKDIADIDLYKELTSFLIDTSNTNYRNEICHGLMNPILIEYYGIYLWWLSLKMIKQAENYFIINEGQMTTKP